MKKKVFSLFMTFAVVFSMAVPALATEWDETIETHTVTFDYKDGSGDVESIEVTSGEAYGELPIPKERDGYVFQGWSLDGTVKLTSAVMADTTVTTDANHTLYAIWAVDVSKAFNVSYDSNGATSGTVPVDSMNYISGSVGIVSGQGDLICEVYTFIGWNTEADGTGTSYSEGDWITVDYDVTLYAQWDANTYDAESIEIGGVAYYYGLESAVSAVSGENEVGQIGDTGVYYAAAAGETPLSGTLYGTAAMTYAEYYYGDINGINADDSNSTIDTSLEVNPSDELYTEGLYDAVTSATSTAGSHSQHYPTILNYTAGSDDADMTIDGIDTVDVAMDAELYVQAMILNAVGTETAAGTSAAKITLNEDISESAYGNNVKTLLGDGSYSAAAAIETGNDVIDTGSVAITPSVSYSSSYGDYQFTMTFNGFNTTSGDELYYNDFLMDMYAAVITDGTNTAGMVYYEDVWEETTHTYYIDFVLSSGDVNARNHEYTNNRFESFFIDEDTLAPGEYTITLKSRGYEDITATFNVGSKLADGEGITVKDAYWTEDGAAVAIDSTLPEDFSTDSIALTKGSGRNAVTLTEGADYDYSDWTLTVYATDYTGIGAYTVTLTDNDYESASASFTLKSSLTQADISMDKDGQLSIAGDEDGSQLTVYAVAISSVTVTDSDGNSTTYNTSGQNSATVITSGGKVNPDAVATSGGPGGGTSTPVFAEDENYTLTISATGYNTFTFEYSTMNVAATSIKIDGSAIATLRKNKTLQLGVTVAPAEANPTIVWTSSNTSVATVDENGLVTAVKTGTVIITATTEDGGLSSYVTIRVTA